MDFKIVALIAVVFAAAFWLWPYQTMLQTSNRLGDNRFRDFVTEVDFPFYSPRRIALTTIGLIGSLALYAAFPAHWIAAVAVFISLSAIFLSDFAEIERVAKRVSGTRKDGSSSS